MQPIKTQICKVCLGDLGRKTFQVREMMFGSGDVFSYVECENCGSLQLENPPVDLTKYYPQNYYSLSDESISEKDNIIVSFLRRQRALYGIKGKSVIGKIVHSRSPKAYYEWFKRANVGFHDSILSVGCGIGNRLITFSKEGFTNLLGIEPYIKGDIYYNSKVRVIKRELSELEGKFDFIMLNHSFEHMAEPREALKEIYRLSRPGKYVMIRTPVVPCYAFREYGENWVQIDAPRHHFIFSKRGIEILAKEFGFQVRDVFYDSYDIQFWGSEQYRKGIPLMDKRSYRVNPEASIFKKEEIQEFKRRAKELNQNEDGDQAVFFLFKP